MGLNHEQMLNAMRKAIKVLIDEGVAYCLQYHGEEIFLIKDHNDQPDEFNSFSDFQERKKPIMDIFDIRPNDDIVIITNLDESRMSVNINWDNNVLISFLCDYIGTIIPSYCNLFSNNTALNDLVNSLKKINLKDTRGNSKEIHDAIDSLALIMKTMKGDADTQKNNLDTYIFSLFREINSENIKSYDLYDYILRKIEYDDFDESYSSDLNRVLDKIAENELKNAFCLFTEDLCLFAKCFQDFDSNNIRNILSRVADIKFWSNFVDFRSNLHSKYDQKIYDIYQSAKAYLDAESVKDKIHKSLEIFDEFFSFSLKAKDKIHNFSRFIEKLIDIGSNLRNHVSECDEMIDESGFSNEDSDWAGYGNKTSHFLSVFEDIQNEIDSIKDKADKWAEKMDSLCSKLEYEAFGPLQETLREILEEHGIPSIDEVNVNQLASESPNYLENCKDHFCQEEFELQNQLLLRYLLK